VAQDNICDSTMVRHADDSRLSRLSLNPRRTLALFIFSALAFSPGFVARGQQVTMTTVDLDRGIKLYQQGDFRGASAALQIAVKRKKNDISAWHYLGLALNQLGKKDDARKAHEKSAKI